MTNRYERSANRLTIVLLVVLAGISIAGMVTLPSRIPIHYNWRGQPDRWGSLSTVLIMPLLALLLSGLLPLTKRIPASLMNFPGPQTPENIDLQVANIWLMIASLRVFIVLLFLALQSQFIWAAAQSQPRLSLVVLPLIVVIQFGVIGFFIWRAYKLVPRS